MFEGSNIHYSADNKLLCSHSAKLCKLRRLAGYGFCCRHILEDPSAPFKQCTYVRNKYRCSVPVQKNKQSDLCNKHEHKVKDAQEQEGQEPHLGTLLLPSPGHPSPLHNGISPTPPSTPTHDPSRMSLMDRIKSKFTRVQNCPTEDMIVNVEDDVDPYAFSDNDCLSLKSSVSSDVHPSQTVAVLDAGTPGHSASALFSNCSAVNVPQSVCVSPVYSLGNSVCTSLPPTPPSGETPIAKMYPELLGKLHASPPPLLDRSPSVSAVGRTFSKPKCCTVVLAQKSRSTVGKPASPLMGKAQKWPKATGSGKTSASGKGRKAGSASENSKSGPLSGSIHSSRTMNKLQNKIAQNKIQDKIRSKAKQQKEAGAPPQNPALSLMSATLPPLQTGLSSSVTSTIFSLGSIPSLGTFLSTQHQQSGTGNESDNHGSSNKGTNSLTLPVALPLLSNQPLLSPNINSGANIPMVIPATVFTPFPNLAGALNLQHKESEESKNHSGSKTTATTSKAKSRSNKVSKVSKEGLKLTIKKSAVKGKKLKKARASTTTLCDKNRDVEIVDHLKTEGIRSMNGAQTFNVLQLSSQSRTFHPQSKVSKSQMRNQSKKVSHSLKKKRKKVTARRANRRPKTLALKSCHGVSRVVTGCDFESLTVSHDSGVSARTLTDVKGNKLPSLKSESGNREEPTNLKPPAVDLQSSTPYPRTTPENDVLREKPEVKESHKTTFVRSKLKRLNNALMSECEVKKKFRRKSAWNYYRIYAEERRSNSTLLPFGIGSSSDDDGSQMTSLQRDPLVFSDDEKITDKELYDRNLLSAIRTTQESLVRSKCRRRLSQLQRHSRGACGYHANNKQSAQALLNVAKRSPAAASELVLATDNCTDSKTRMHTKLESRGDAVVKRHCLVRDKDTNVICDKPALPYSNHCMRHIMYNVDQKLFDYCTAKFANNTQCCVSVFDVTHELPLCSEHARKADNYQRNQEERQVRKPRKKTKPSALTRPPKKGKKRKKIAAKLDMDQVVITKDNIMDSCLDLASSDTEKGEGLETNLAALPSQSDSQDDDMVQQARTNGDVLTEIPDGLDSDIEEPFSPGMIEKNLDLPLDFEEATKLLDKHDLDMLNKMPDDAFDLFAAVSEKNEQLIPTGEETDMLEKAIAEASNSLNLHQHSDLPALTRDDLTKLTTMERVHSNPPADYMSDNEEKADELTKQIASSLMHRNPLSDDEDDLDHDSLNNLASSLTPNDLRSISQALIGSDIDIALVASGHSEESAATTSSQLNGLVQQEVRYQGQVQGHLAPVQGQLPVMHGQLPVIPHSQSQNYLSSMPNQSLPVQGLCQTVAVQGHIAPVQSRDSSARGEMLTNHGAQISCQNPMPVAVGNSPSSGPSQLSRLLSHANGAGNGNTSQHALQENIRVFLNASSATHALSQLSRNTCQESSTSNYVSTTHSILHDFLTQAKNTSPTMPPGSSDALLTSHVQLTQNQNEKVSIQPPAKTSHTEVNLEQLNKQLQLQFNSSQSAINQSILNAINALNASQNSQISLPSSNTSQSFVFSLPDCRTPGVPNVSLKPGSRPQPIPGVHKVTSAPTTHSASHTPARLQIPAVQANQNVASILAGLASQQSFTMPVSFPGQNATAVTSTSPLRSNGPPTVMPANQNASNPVISSQILSSQPPAVLNHTTTPVTQNHIASANLLTNSNHVSLATILTNQNAASIPAPIMSCRPSENRSKSSHLDNSQVSSQLVPNLKSNVQTKASQSQCSVITMPTASTQAPVLPSPNSIVQSMTSSQLMGTIIDAMRCQLPPNAVVSNVPPNVQDVTPKNVGTVPTTSKVSATDLTTEVLPNDITVQHGLANSSLAQPQNNLNVHILQQGLPVANSQFPTNQRNSQAVAQHSNGQQLPTQAAVHSNSMVAKQKQETFSVAAGDSLPVSQGPAQKASKATVNTKTKTRRRSETKNALIMQKNSSQIRNNKVVSLPNQNAQTQLHSNAAATQVLPNNAILQHIMPKQSTPNHPVAIATSLPGVATLAQLPNGLQALLAALQGQSQASTQAGVGLKVPYPIQTVQIPPGIQVFTNNTVTPQTVAVAPQPIATQPFLTIATMQPSQPPQPAVKVNKQESGSDR